MNLVKEAMQFACIRNIQNRIFLMSNNRTNWINFNFCIKALKKKPQNTKFFVVYINIVYVIDFYGT